MRRLLIPSFALLLLACSATVSTTLADAALDGDGSATHDGSAAHDGDRIEADGDQVEADGNSDGADASGPFVWLIVFNGESNAAGIAPNSSATAAEREPRPAVQILNNYELVFQALDLDQNNNIDNATPWNESHSWEIGLADAVEAERLPNPSYLVKAAASGTRIDQWLPDGGGTWWANMTNKLDTATTLLNTAGLSYRIAVWYSLGLNDALAGTPPLQWKADVESYFAAFRARYGADIRIYMTRFHEYAETPGDGLGHPYNPTIDAIAAEDPLTEVVPTQGASYLDPYVHWDYAGMKVIADRIVTMMLAAP